MMVTNKEFFYNDMKEFLWYWDMYLLTSDDWYKGMAEIRLVHAKRWFREALKKKRK